MAKKPTIVDGEVDDTPNPEPTFEGYDGELFATAEEALASYKVAKEEKTALAAFADGDEENLDDIPEHLRFSTYAEEDPDEPEREHVVIALDDRIRAKLYKPSMTAYQLLAGALSGNADNADRMYAIQNLMNNCLDENGRIYVKNRALAHPGSGKYDDKLLGRITDTIMTTWGDELDPAKNRAQKRAAAKAGKKKGR